MAADESRYMAHLDGIRAFAVGGVILEHWASGMPRLIRDAVGHLDLGGWGVECFFVLSGFLITQILLDAKSRQSPFATALGHFYGRRVLRIFPAYYLVLLVVALVSPVMREVLPWHLFYLGNLYPLWHGSFAPSGGHFWSLAVEEQFYLFWPLIVLMVPTRLLPMVAVVLIVAAPISRWALRAMLGGDPLAMWTFPTTALDLLAFGALLAWLRRERGLQPDSPFVKALSRLGLLAVPLYLGAYLTLHGHSDFTVLSRSATALIFGALVLRASFGMPGFAGRLLGNWLVRWLGTVSYGLYLIHPFVPDLYLHMLSVMNLPAGRWGVYYLRIPLMTMMLLGLTAASFYLWERPIRSYRRLLD
jgi:peptidoglycan/LPS O-acetylase OafA/YrhL